MGNTSKGELLKNPCTYKTLSTGAYGFQKILFVTVPLVMKLGKIVIIFILISLCSLQ